MLLPNMLNECHYFLHWSLKTNVYFNHREIILSQETSLTCPATKSTQIHYLFKTVIKEC